MKKVYNVKENVIPVKRSASGNLLRCPVKRGMTESGRSMVEMLGVLAVIGVLSVAGIAGYSNAMRSYRTNEIINAASKLYILGLAQNAASGTGTLLYSTTIGARPSGCSEITYNSPTSLTMIIDDEADCQQVANKIGANGTITAGTCTASASGYTLELTYGSPNAVEVAEGPVLGDPCDYDESDVCVNSKFVYCDHNASPEPIWASDGSPSCGFGKVCKGNECVEDSDNEAWRCNGGTVEVMGNNSWEEYTTYHDCVYCEGNKLVHRNNLETWCVNGELFACDSGEHGSCQVSVFSSLCDNYTCNGNTVVEL